MHLVVNNSFFHKHKSLIYEFLFRVLCNSNKVYRNDVNVNKPTNVHTCMPLYTQTLQHKKIQEGVWVFKDTGQAHGDRFY